MEVLLVLIGLMLATVIVVAAGDRIGLPWPALLTILTAVAVFIYATFSSGEFEFEVRRTLSSPSSSRRCSGRWHARPRGVLSGNSG